MATLIMATLQAGCNHKKPTDDVSQTQTELQGTASNTVSARDIDPGLEQSFTEATVSEAPPDWQRPPDVTMTNKSVGQLYTQVVQLWDQIHFTAPNGKKIQYKALFETEMGPIEISLRPDLAPNHVRSFIALSKAGYYDGLVFERTINQEVDGRQDAKVQLIEAGCPMGTGEAGYGSIGYWLKPEIKPEATHEEGTVGASHGEDADTGACKFYINLRKAPFMDGNYTVFGKVTQGLNTARKILSLPIRNDSDYPEGDRPAKPVVISKVTIQESE